MTTNQKYWSSQPHPNLIRRGKISQEFYATAVQLKLKWEIQGQVDLGQKHFCHTAGVFVLVLSGCESLFSWHVWRTRDHTGAIVSM